MLIRDIALLDKHRNKDLQDAGENIPSNILANRLKQLLEHGLLEKRLYQEPPRYEYHLTKSGEGILLVIKEMAKWAETYVDGVTIPGKTRSYFTFINTPWRIPWQVAWTGDSGGQPTKSVMLMRAIERAYGR